MADAGTRLREAREKAGFNSASQAAKQHGWRPSSYIAHENGQNTLRASVAKAYAEAFGVTPEWLLFGGAEDLPLTAEHTDVAQSPASDVHDVDPLLLQAWKRLSRKGRRQLVQIAVLLAGDGE